MRKRRFSDVCVFIDGKFTPVTKANFNELLEFAFKNLSAGTLNLKNANLQSGDKADILRDASNLVGANEGESSADILKKQLEKLQKRLKELEAAIKRVKASKNPYAKDMVASLETQKGAVFAQIMQISARILEMQGSQSTI